MNRKKWFIVLQYLMLLIFIMTLTLVIECVIFQFPAIRYKETPQTFGFTGSSTDITSKEILVELSADEVKSIEVARENEKMLAEYQGLAYEEKEDPTLVIENGVYYRKVNEIQMLLDIGSTYYIHKLKLQAPVTSSCGYHVTLLSGGKEVKKDIYCSIEPKIEAGICNVKAKADQMQIRILTSEKINPKDITVTISNSFRPNVMRMNAIFMLFLLGLLLAGAAKWIAEKPEWIFAIVCFALGQLLIFGIGTNQVSYDEYVHAKSAYKLSFGTTIESTETAIQMAGNLLPYFNNPEERDLIEAYEDSNHDYSWADIGHQSRFVRTETRVYYPLAIGFYLGRKLHLSFATTVALAKLGNLLFYIFIVFFAVKWAKKYKYLVALIGLLPNCVFLAAAITYDAIVNSFLLLGSVLILNEIIDPSKKLNYKNTLLILLSFFVGCQSKPIYIVMALMIVFFKKDKFENRFQEVVLKLSVIVITGLMLYNIFRPTPAAGSDFILVGNFSFAGDKRNVGTSVTGQIDYIFHNPLVYTQTLLKSMFGMLIGYLDGKANFFQYGYLGTCSTFFTYLVLALAFWLSIWKPNKELRIGSEVYFKVLNIIMILGTAAVVWTSMYASYTPVGSKIISGVQGRYFIPLFLPFFSVFMNSKLESRLGNVGRGRITFGVMACLNLWMISRLVIAVMNV